MKRPKDSPERIKPDTYHWSGTGEYRPDRKDTDVTSSEHEIRIRVVPVVDTDMLGQVTAALEELRTGIKKMADAFAEAVRVLEDGDTDTGDIPDSYRPNDDILPCADTGTETWTVASGTVHVLCHDPGHFWGGVHPHPWTKPGTGDDPDRQFICPGY